MRRAFLCDHKDHGGVPIRRFVGREEKPPICPKHGKMKPQENALYFGRKV